MKCHNCSIEFDSLNNNDIFCTGTCIRIAKENGWKPSEHATPQENPEISASRKKWNEAYAKYLEYRNNLREVMETMNWCLRVDRHEEARKMKVYFKKEGDKS